MQEDRPDLEGMSILTATVHTQCIRCYGHGSEFSNPPSLHCLQLYGLYRGVEGETVRLSSLMETIGGSEDALPTEQFIR